MSKDISIGSRAASSSIDAFFSKEPKRVASTGKVRIASAIDLSGFIRVSSDNKLIRLSQKDFWKLGKDDEGFFIEKLVDDLQGPINE